MFKYEIKQYIGIDNFNKGVNEMAADSWILYMNHTVYYNPKEESTIYTQVFQKFINEPDKTK